jgi:pimeloyl-ACP methyl ester carboxylesterase
MSVQKTGSAMPRPAWLPSQQWPFSLRQQTVLGHRIHYIDEGDGPVLLFVHAGMWAFVWRDVIRELSTDFRCIALDFPGSGLSELQPSYEIGLAGHARVLGEFTRQLHLRDVTLVLHDLGGLIGLDFARSSPDLVRALVLSQTFGWWPRQRLLQGMLGLMGGPAMRTFNTSTNLIPRLTASRFGVGRHLDREGRQAFLGPVRDRRRRRAFHDLMRDTRRSHLLLRALRTAVEEDLSDRPVLTIFGERNDPLHFQQTWRELFPAARQVVVPKGNHFPMNDDPSLFAAAIRTWWRDTVTPPSNFPGRSETA